MQQKGKLLTSRRGLVTAAACTLALVAGWVLWIRSNHPLNVILITLDTTRADRLGTYGYSKGLTEILDQYAEQGVVFERAYAPVPLTLPSHTTMLTGLYPPEHGLRVNGSGTLGRDAPLLPDILKRRGYDTGAFLAAFVLHSKFGLNRGFDVYDDDLSDSKPDGEHSFERRRLGIKVVDSALNWLEQRAAKPFFCWIHLYDAHAPYNDRPELFGGQFKEQPYDAGIAVEVQQVARVLQFLKDRKLDDHTLVVIVGDHGEGLGEHGEEEHGNLLYDSTVRVPLVVVAPKFCLPGHRVAEPVSLVDLTPTILDVLNIPALKETRGRSLQAALAGGTLAPRPCYVETEAPFLDNRWCPMQAVVTKRWKYVHTTRSELFDLEQDPGEKNNLLETASQEREEMQGLLEEIQEQFAPASAENVHLSEKDRRILESLGYVGGKASDNSKGKAAEVLPDMKDMLPYMAKMENVSHMVSAGDFQGAAKLAREVVAATSPNYPMAEVILGDVLRQQGALDEAVAVYQSVLKKDPDCIKAHARLGDFYASQRRWKQAANEFRAVIKLEPEAAHAHFDLAEMLSRMNQPDAAFLEYREATRSDPGFVTAHFELGLLLAKSHRLDESVFEFEQALKYEPRLSLAHMNLSSVLLQLKRIPEALEHLQAAVELEPQSFEARVNLGTLLFMQEKYDDALVQFREAQRIRPHDPLPQKNIREIGAKLGPDR